MQFPPVCRCTCYLWTLLAMLSVSPALLGAEPQVSKQPSIRLRTTYGLGTQRPAVFVVNETISVRADVYGVKADAKGDYHFATEASLIDDSGKTIEKLKLQKHQPNRYGGQTIHLSLSVPQTTPEGTYRFQVTARDLVSNSQSTSELEIKLLPAQSQSVTDLRLAWKPATSLRDAQTHLMAAVSPKWIRPGARDVPCTMLVRDEKRQLIGKPVMGKVTDTPQKDENGRPYNLSLQLPSLPPGNYQIRLLVPNQQGEVATPYTINYRIPEFASVVDVVR